MQARKIASSISVLILDLSLGGHKEKTLVWVFSFGLLENGWVVAVEVDVSKVRQHHANDHGFDGDALVQNLREHNCLVSLGVYYTPC